MGTLPAFTNVRDLLASIDLAEHLFAHETCGYDDLLDLKQFDHQDLTEVQRLVVAEGNVTAAQANKVLAHGRGPAPSPHPSTLLAGHPSRPTLTRLLLWPSHRWLARSSGMRPKRRKQNISAGAVSRPATTLRGNRGPLGSQRRFLALWPPARLRRSIAMATVS